MLMRFSALLRYPFVTWGNECDWIEMRITDTEIKDGEKIWKLCFVIIKEVDKTFSI